MLYRKHGIPEVEEIVLCKVTKLYPNSVFVEMLEYGNKVGVVYISEVAPGRIRNLREYVEIGRQIVCKVIRIDPATGNIDLSLRRANSTQRAEKLEEIKQELKAESILKSVSEKLKKPLYEIYTQVSSKVLKEYSHLFVCFREIAAGNADLEKLGVEKNIAKELTAIILEKFKPAKVFLTGEISLKTYASDGIDKVKAALAGIGKISSTITLAYLGGGKYKFTLEDTDYKTAEKTLRKLEEFIDKFNDKISTASITREKSE